MTPRTDRGRPPSRGQALTAYPFQILIQEISAVQRSPHRGGESWQPARTNNSAGVRAGMDGGTLGHTFIALCIRHVGDTRVVRIVADAGPCMTL